MREIKFRFYNQDTKRFYSFINGLYFDDAGKVGAYVFGWDKAEQFTGLKDKNGVEIYAGDIIRTEYGLDVATMERFPKFWLKKESFGYKGEKTQDPELCEVVGNIHENPELLEAEK